MDYKNNLLTDNKSIKKMRLPGFNGSLIFSSLSYLFILIFVFIFDGCFSYSFTGASVPPYIKTVAIPIADDISGVGEPGLREKFTDELIKKFIDDNTLQVSDKVNANALIEMKIVSLTDTPTIVSAGESVTTRRITIVVEVTYKDLVNKKNIFNKRFSNYGDYPPAGTVEKRQEAINTAVDKITEDILLDVVSGW